MNKKKPSCEGRPVIHHISEELLADSSVEEWAKTSMGCYYCPFYVESTEDTLLKCDPDVSVRIDRGRSRIKATVTPK